MGQYKTNKDYSEWWIEESYSSGDQEEKKNRTGKAERVKLKFFFFWHTDWKYPGDSLCIKMWSFYSIFPPTGSM